MVEYSQLGISDNFMFGLIMQEPERCRRFLEQILGFPIEHIEYVEREKSVEEKIDAHGIRLDIYAEDGRAIYDCEMQTSLGKKLPKRSRYYQGHIGINHLKPGDDYEKLKKSFIIFICTFDPFEAGRYVYTFENLCLEDNSLPLNDEAVKVFVNTKGTVGNVSDEFKELMHFLDTSELRNYKNELVNELALALADARSRDEWRKEYMSIEMLKNECRAEGREQGREENKRENALRMLKKGLETLFVAECVDLPLDEVQALAATL